MNPKTLPLLVALAVALSGCLGIFGDDPEPVNGDTDNGDNGDSDNGDADNGDNGANDDNGDDDGPDPILPPTASLTADVVAGATPLNITFTLDGDDPEDFSINWTLDAGDGSAPYTGSGDDLPLDVEHSFEAVGNYTAVFEVTNGEFTETEQLNITVSEPEPVPELVAEYEESADFVGGLVADPPEIVLLQCPGFVLGVNGLGCVFFEFEDDFSGMRYEVETETESLRYAIWDECDPTGHGLESAGVEESFHEGEIPDGAGCFIVWGPVTHTADAPITYQFRVFTF